MLLLSSINHIVGVESNLIRTAKYISKKKIIFFKIKNGYNSKNIFIASFLSLFVIGFTMGGLNYIITILQARTRGMTLMRMPLTIWGIFTDQ